MLRTRPAGEEKEEGRRRKDGGGHGTGFILLSRGRERERGGSEGCVVGSGSGISVGCGAVGG